MNSSRNLVIVSGYYGFDNLGDEAILEQICIELKQLVSPEQIVVLSASPEDTEARYGVKAAKRDDIRGLIDLLRSCRLFISGGGGLFQNTKNLLSIIFYGLQIELARKLGAKVLIYAQGIGPLNGALAQALTRRFFRQADEISVRDDDSYARAKAWGLRVNRTADPVWALAESPMPPSVAAYFDHPRQAALSLRPASDLTDEHLHLLSSLLEAYLPPDTKLLLVPLQPAQDLPVCRQFLTHYSATGLPHALVDPGEMPLPSMWLSFFGRCQEIVAMRLHALIMALKSGRPVAGIKYDPKVSHLLGEFGQPDLILTHELLPEQWGKSLKSLVYQSDTLSQQARSRFQVAKKLSCQNFEILARILSM